MTSLRKPAILCAVVFSFVYLLYRGLFSLNLESWYALTASWVLFAAEVWGCMLMYLYFFQIWEIKQPETIPAPSGKTVDVFLPTYNEDVELLRGSIAALNRLDYPHKTFVLDDGNRDEVKALADEMGVEYIAREDNLFNKAGNLNNALDQTEGEFVVILDADHIAKPDFISKTLGHFQDEKMAFVQTPHAFYNFDNFQGHLNYKKGVYWEEGQLFYNVIQPGKTHWNANVFCGSAAIFRRAALEDVGLIATAIITEDIQTGLRMHAKGWKSTYVSERLIAAQAAPDISSFTSQRLRWGEGNLSLLFHDNPLTVKGLTIAQRLNYLGSILGWTTGPVKIGLYLTPILMLFSGIAPVGEFTWTLGAITAIYLISVWSAVKIASNGVGRLWDIEVQAMANFWLQCVACYRAIVRRGLGKFVVTKKRGSQSNSKLPLVYPHIGLIALGLSAIAWSLGKIVMGVSNDWIGLGVGSALIIVQSLWAFAVVRKAFRAEEKRFSWRHPIFDLHVGYKQKTEGALAGQALAVDLNEKGLGFMSYQPFQVGDPVELVLTTPGLQVECKAEVRNCFEAVPGKGVSGYRVGVKFVDLSSKALNDIWIMSSVDAVNDHYERLSDRRGYAKGNDRFPGQIQPLEGEKHVAISAIVGKLSVDSFAFKTSQQVDIEQAYQARIDSPVGEISVEGQLQPVPMESESGLGQYKFVITKFGGQSRSQLMNLLSTNQKATAAVSRPKPNKQKDPVLQPGFATSGLALAASIGCVVLCWNIWGANFLVSQVSKNGEVTTNDKVMVDELFDEVVKEGPYQTDLPFLLNARKAFEETGDEKRLNEASLAILKLQPGNTGLQIYRANVLLEQGDCEDAHQHFDEILAGLPEDSPALLEANLGLARCFAKCKDWASSEKHYRLVYESDKTNFDAAAELAYVLINLDLPDQASTVYESIPDEHDKKDHLFVHIALNKKEYDKAEMRILDMLSDAPEDESLQELLADCYLSNGVFDKAASIYLRLSDSSKRPSVDNKLGVTQFLAGNYRDAVDTLNQSELLDGKDRGTEKAWLHYLLSVQKLDTISPECEQRLNQLSVQIENGQWSKVELTLQLAEVFAKHGDSDRAIRLFRDGIPNADNPRKWQTRLAQVLQSEKRFEEADVVYRKLLLTSDKSATPEMTHVEMVRPLTSFKISF